MNLKFWRADLQLVHRWTIASSLGSGGGGGKDAYKVVFVELKDANGVTGIGEAAPSSRYHESVESCVSFLEHVDPERLSFEDVDESMAYLEGIAPGQFAPKGALNIALMDGAARRAGKPVCDFLGLGFTEGRHVTSFSIGIDRPEVIEKKVLLAAHYPILKLKVGSGEDAQNLKALRTAAPHTRVRVDANEAWKTKEEALERIEWLALDGQIEFVEQPMPASSNPGDLQWLKKRSPLPIMADEAYLSADDISRCADCYDSVNVKLVKTGGISGAFQALRAAKAAGLKTMIGCMIESSVLITAAAHLAELTDYLDIDGNLLISNDPYAGVGSENGEISFAKTVETAGLRVRRREPQQD